MKTAATDAAIARLRDSGAGLSDPIGLAWVEALARRTTGERGALRLALDKRLADAVAACSARLEAASDEGSSITPLASPTHAPAALADLVQRLARDAGDATSSTHAEPRALRQARQAWVQLDVERQVAQSLRKASPQAGPLNSHHLVLRALQTMQQASPAYLAAFVGQVETLLWLDQTYKLRK